MWNWFICRIVEQYINFCIDFQEFHLCFLPVSFCVLGYCRRCRRGASQYSFYMNSCMARYCEIRHLCPFCSCLWAVAVKIMIRRMTLRLKHTHTNFMFLSCHTLHILFVSYLLVLNVVSGLDLGRFFSIWTFGYIFVRYWFDSWRVTPRHCYNPIIHRAPVFVFQI